LIALLLRDDAAATTPRSRRERLGTLLAGGLMGVAFTLWNYSIGYVGAGLATVLGNTQVVFVGLFAWWVFRERPPRATVLAVPLVLGGVVLATGVGRPDAYGSDPVLGVLFGVFNALSYAAFLLIFRRTARGATRPGGPCSTPPLGAAVVTLVLGLLTDPAFDLRPVWPAHGWLLALAIGSQTIAWGAILVVLPRLPALDTSSSCWCSRADGRVGGVAVRRAAVALAVGGGGVGPRRGRGGRAGGRGRAWSPAGLTGARWAPAAASPTAHRAAVGRCRTLVACAGSCRSFRSCSPPCWPPVRRGHRQPQQPRRPPARSAATATAGETVYVRSTFPSGAFGLPADAFAGAFSIPLGVDGSGARVTSEFEFDRRRGPRRLDVAPRRRLVWSRAAGDRRCSW
jgi:hypothetical protein